MVQQVGARWFAAAFDHPQFLKLTQPIALAVCIGTHKMGRKALDLVQHTARF
jgi:hypothetical protein